MWVNHTQSPRGKRCELTTHSHRGVRGELTTHSHSPRGERCELTTHSQSPKSHQSESQVPESQITFRFKVQSIETKMEKVIKSQVKCLLHSSRQLDFNVRSTHRVTWGRITQSKSFYTSSKHKSLYQNLSNSLLQRQKPIIQKPWQAEIPLRKIAGMKQSKGVL